MNTIAAIRSDLYHVPLPVVLTDSAHGEMKYFELVTVRLAASDGAEGMGYTYTVGAGGGAIHDLIVRELTPRLVGQPAANIEALWQTMWCTLHYGAGLQRRRNRARAHHRLQLRTCSRIEHQISFRTSHRHGDISIREDT